MLHAFGALQLGRTRATSTLYQAANCIGGALLCTSAVMTESWPFAVLNAVWAAVAAATLLGWTSPDPHRTTSGPP